MGIGGPEEKKIQLVRSVSSLDSKFGKANLSNGIIIYTNAHSNELYPESDHECYFKDFNTSLAFNGSTLTVHEHGQDGKWTKDD